MSAPVICLRLRDRTAKLVFMAASGAMALVLALTAAWVGMAGYWGDSLVVTRVERAARLDPRDARLQFRLGQLYGWGSLDTQRAVAHFRRAVQLSPQRAAYWSGMGWACLAAVDQDCSSEAFRKAVQLAPMSPQSYWTLANYLAITGSEADVLTALTGFLRLNQQVEPSDATPAFRVYVRAFGNSDGLWKTLQDRPLLQPVRMSFIDFLAADGRTDAAVRHWGELVANHGSIKLGEALPFLRDLLNHGRYAEAAQAWKDAQKIGLVEGSRERETVFNGSFERPPLEVAFDWQYRPTRYVRATFAATPAHEGQRSLQVSYTVADNSESMPVVEMVPVAPNQRYRLSAFVRSNEVTSDSGPRLRIDDPECPSCPNLTTDSTIGTTPWHAITLDFTTGPNAHLAAISVWRGRSRTYPMDITGEFWIDSVSVTTQANESAK